MQSHYTPQAYTVPIGNSSLRSKRTEAYKVAEQHIGKSHSAGLLAYHKLLIWRAGHRSYSVATRKELALALAEPVVTRTIQRYDDRLVELGLIRLEKEGVSYRRYIAAWDDEPTEPDEQPPEVVIITDDEAPSVDRSIQPEWTDRSQPFPLINNQGSNHSMAAPPGDGGKPPSRFPFPIRQRLSLRDVPETPATRTLLTLGAKSPERIIALKDVDPEHILQTIADLDHAKGEGMWGVGLLLLALEQGVYESRRRKPQEARHADAAYVTSNPECCAKCSTFHPPDVPCRDMAAFFS